MVPCEFRMSDVAQLDVDKLSSSNNGLVCLFVCFVGLFHIGNWNFWLVMA